MCTLRPPRYFLCFALVILSVSTSAGQAPTARLRVTKSSGFLGIGSPRFVTVRLSTPGGDTALTSETVNGHALYSFVVKPSGEWYPDDDFCTSLLPTLTILQGDSLFGLTAASETRAGDSSIVVGFSRNLRLTRPFEFRIGSEDEVFTVSFEVPHFLWPGYARLEVLSLAAQESRRAGKPRLAVAAIDSALIDPSLQEFSQLSALREARTTLMMALASAASARLDSALGSPSMPLGEKVSIAQAAADDLSFAADSLQAGSLGIRAADPALIGLAARLRGQAARSASLRDSLQEQYDLEQIAWILERGNYANNGLAYDHMIEALAYATSSVDFLDTAQVSFSPSLPADIRERLALEGTLDDYAIFVRMCNDRYRRGDSVYPGGFLAMVRADTARHALPVYDMLRAFSEYWSGAFGDAGTAAREVMRKATDPLLVSRFDMLRVATGIRLGRYAPKHAQTLATAQRLIAQGDEDGAAEVLDAVGNAPGMGAIAVVRGYLALSRGDTGRALAQYEAAWLSDPLSVDAYLRGAEIARARGNLRSAAEILRRALEHGADYWLVFYTLGMTYLEDDKYPGALSALESAQLIAPRNYETALALGLTHQEAGDIRRARDYYNRAISIDPLRTEAVDLLTNLKRINRPPR